MGRTKVRPSITIRPFVIDDEPAVLDLLGATLGGGPAGRRPASFFRWKHLDNPFGTSFMLVAESDGRLVGLRAFMRWRFAAGDQCLRAVRAVDTATHPDFQGMGIFSRLTQAAVEALHGVADLVYNTPNAASRPGYLKMGWRDAGHVPVAVRVRRPLHFAMGLRRSAERLSAKPSILAPPFTQLLDREDEITRLLAEVGADDRIHTPRDITYLRWRYAAAPLLDYRVVIEEDVGRLQGLAIFRVRPRGALWESTLAEVLVPAGDRRTARRLLSKAAAAAGVDNLTFHAPTGTAAAAATTLAGFLPTPGGMVFVVKPLRGDLRPDPADLRAWALSLGDLEVF